MTVIRRILLSLASLIMICQTVVSARRPGTMLAEAGEAVRSGRYAAAIRLADSVASMSNNELTRLEAYDLLTRATRAIGNFTACDIYFRKAMEMADRSDVLRGNEREVRNMLFNYAQFLLSMGRYDESLKLTDSIIYPEGSESEIRRAGLKASVLFRKGDTPQSLQLLDSTIDNAGNSPSLASLLQNRGYISGASNRHAEAYSYLSRASGLLEGKERGIALANAALALSGLDRHDEAVKTIETALKTIEHHAGKKDADYIIALRKKGEILIHAGQTEEASTVMHDFFNRERNRLSALLPTLTPQARLDYWTKEKPLLSRCFMLGENDPGFLFEVALTRRETSLLGTGRTSYTDPFSTNVTDEILGKLSKGEAAVAFVTYPDISGNIQYAAITLSRKGQGAFVPLFAEEFINEPGTVAGRTLSEAVASEDPADKNRLYSDTLLAEMIWRPILRRLPDDTHTIHFAPEGVFHLWGIENMPFEGHENYSLVRHFSLFDISDAGKGITGNALVAGGLDYNSPAETSPADTEPDRNAYEELKRYYPLNMQGRIFTYLPGTAAEAEKVAMTIGACETKRILTEDTFKNRAGSYNMLHLATHAYSLDCGIADTRHNEADSIGIDLSLLRSGFALSGANIMGEKTGNEDGILSAREICDIDLGKVDMAVLSACQTAKGVITDESASGIVRALKNAGVRTIVATLWEVDDRATMKFMDIFYRNLSAGMTRQQAFDRARRELRDHVIKTPVRKFDAAALASRTTTEYTETCPYSSPWFWAPFILIDP